MEAPLDFYYLEHLKRKKKLQILRYFCFTQKMLHKILLIFLFISSKQLHWDQSITQNIVSYVVIWLNQSGKKSVISFLISKLVWT